MEKLKFKVVCSLKSSTIYEEIECRELIMHKGAYLFLSREWYDETSYKYIIKSFPVECTVVEKL